MNAAEAVGRLARWMVVRQGAEPARERLQGLQACELFDSCLLRWDGDDLRIDALLADPGGLADALAGRAEALRRGLEAVTAHVAGRVRAAVWIVCDRAARAAELRGALLDQEDGHFLSKVLVGRGVLCPADGSAAYAGRSPGRPGADALLAVLRDEAGDPGEDAAVVAQLRRRHDERAVQRALAPGPAPLTWALIGLNVAAYLLQLHVKGLFEGQGLDPGRAANAAMLSLGANLRWGSQPGFQAWRLLAAAFLHGNELHLGMNMWALYQVGRLAERLVGWKRLAPFYLAAAVISSFVSSLFLPLGTPSLGASGAILGLAGLLLAPRWRRHPAFPRVLAQSLHQWLARPMLFLFVVGFGLQFLHTPMQFDNMAHLGGLCFGFGLGYLFPSFLVRPASR